MIEAQMPGEDFVDNISIHSRHTRPAVTAIFSAWITGSYKCIKLIRYNCFTWVGEYVISRRHKFSELFKRKQNFFCCGDVKIN